MPGTPAPTGERSPVWDVAYGFMASTALFAALELDLFTGLADGPQTCAELSARTGVAGNRLQILLHALTGLGLTVVDRGHYAIGPAARRWLVHDGPGLYPAPGGLLAGPGGAGTSIARQHAVSLGAARVLAGRLPIRDARRLLDVGGGSGAFSMALCERNPELRCTLLELPTVAAFAWDSCREAGLGARVDIVAGDAVTCTWPDDRDVVLMSCLLSALGDRDLDVLLAKAWHALRPGGLIVLHDVMLDDAGPGPTAAALWFLQQLAHRSDGVSFSAADLHGRLRAARFRPTTTEPLIPGLTKVVLARKEAVR
jgi:2-hydroxy-4-(methylsulfanyl)butanoate S-methyltransferase